MTGKFRYFDFDHPTEEISPAKWMDQIAELGDREVLHESERYGYLFQIKWFGIVNMTSAGIQYCKYQVSVTSDDCSENHVWFFNDYAEAEGKLLQIRGLLLHAQLVGEDRSRRALLERLARGMRQVIDRKGTDGEGMGQEPAGGARRQAARLPRGWTEDLH